MPATCCLNLYVYNMSKQYTLDIKDHVESVAYSKLGESRWLSSITSGHFTHFENLRTHGADYLMLQKLLHHTRQTSDPRAADLFLIPLLGGLDTILGWGHGLSRVNPSAHGTVLAWDAWATRNLHAWHRLPHRHLILFNMNDEQVPLEMNPATVVHLGPVKTERHHIIVPYLILERSLFLRHPRPRKRTFAYVQMTTSRNPIRKSIQRQLRDKDNVFVDAGVIGKRQRDTVYAMRRSTFCIAPAGDSASFCTRLYFALLSGCIPVRIDTYGSHDSYPYVGPRESLRDLVVNVSPEDVLAQRLLAVLHNVTNVDDRLKRIHGIRRYLLHNPSYDEQDASTMVLTQLVQRKRCEDQVLALRSMYDTRTDATANCSLPDFTLNAEMCWKREIDASHVVALKNKIVRAMIYC